MIGTASPAAASTPVVTPRHGLPYYARVAIHAEKWANTDYTVSECFDSIVGEYCVQVGGGVVPASGVLDTSVVLTRRYDFGDGPPGRLLDCAAPDAACEIVVDAQPVPESAVAHVRSVCAGAHAPREPGRRDSVGSEPVIVTGIGIPSEPVPVGDASRA